MASTAKLSSDNWAFYESDCSQPINMVATADREVKAEEIN